MKTSLVRAFLFSLIVFFILNFLIAIIGYAVADLMSLELSKYQTHPTFFIYRLVYPIGYFPWDLLIIGIPHASFGFKIIYLGIFISLVESGIQKLDRLVESVQNRRNEFSLLQRCYPE